MVKPGNLSKREVGFDWVCFFEASDRVHFYNPLLNRSLSSFEHPANWVCFGFVLGSFFIVRRGVKFP